MKIKTFIFILQLFLCSGIEFYPSVIKRYSDEIFFLPRTKNFGFTLDISQFQDNDKIFIRMNFYQLDVGTNSIKFYYLLSNDYSISDELASTNAIKINRKLDLTNTMEINRKLDLMNAMEINSRKPIQTTTRTTKTNYYFEIEKKEEASYLHFIIESSDFFSFEIGFKNTKKDESKSKVNTAILVVIIIACIIVFIILGTIAVRCANKHGLNNQEEVTVGGPQLYNQQPMYGQPQGSQPQQDQMIVYSQGTNPQENAPNQIETPNQGIKNNNQNNDGGTKDV